MSLGISGMLGAGSGHFSRGLFFSSISLVHILDGSIDFGELDPEDVGCV